MIEIEADPKCEACYRRWGAAWCLRENCMTPSPQLSAFIKRWESCSLTVYLDQAGLPTIGWGHLLEPGESAAPITQEEADALFDHELLHFADRVDDSIWVTVAQHQFDACVSMAFNCGAEAFARSTLCNYLNRGLLSAAADQFLRWDKVRVNGVLTVSRGLHKRRVAERAMFQYADYSGRP